MMKTIKPTAVKAEMTETERIVAAWALLKVTLQPEAVEKHLRMLEEWRSRRVRR